MTTPILLNSCARAATAAEARFRIDAKPQPPRATRVIGLDPGAAAIVRGLAPAAHFRLLESPGELADADFVLMVATANDGAAAAAALGAACAGRGIMTAGVVVGNGRDNADAVTALRPHARVLLVTADVRDIAEILSVVGG